jgi:hypothetical protein
VPDAAASVRATQPFLPSPSASVACEHHRHAPRQAWRVTTVSRRLAAGDRKPDKRAAIACLRLRLQTFWTS